MRNVKIPITLFNCNGDVMGRFDSIQKALEFVGLTNKLSGKCLRLLHSKKSIKRGNYYLVLTIYENDYTPSSWQKPINLRYKTIKRRNKIINCFYRTIFITDKKLNIIRVYPNGNYPQICDDFNISMGCLKANISRSAKWYETIKSRKHLFLKREDFFKLLNKQNDIKGKAN